ncbi:Ser/Thr protein phosphatase 6 regulatory ankyrin repeat subunit B like [Only Syngen Nebraska virus 5]|uniref:Ser/Thr protein phosphatase 6 regulatory ankyrin repeat subunit B like n=1 Tax=Only Syngen Nebraska virus 5 TaxID=1917232 RepID=UPI000900D1DC|nr:Ser/Thr protein phosphatase 6 regulatory ankyrin repeat subunit B like [Only Syngen Nebraska virus 5]APC25867.1 Ser/Thr protein phosphatase 6 regulatory ankyrin repeat subunit B like [Only Syngen Nebraska virus 5]
MIVDERDLTTPLLKAIVSRDREQISSCLSSGIGINKSNHFGFTPLHLATLLNDIYTVIALIERGADVNAKNIHGDSPVDIAIIKKYDDILGVFLGGKNKEYKRENEFCVDKTPLHKAALVGNENTITALVNDGNDVNKLDGNFDAPLHIATHFGYLETVKKLLENGASGNITNFYKKTALHIAVSKNRIDIVQLLVHKTNVNSKDHGGDTPLSLSIKYGYTDIARILLENGAMIGSIDEIEDVVYDMIKKGYEDIIVLFIRYGMKLSEFRKYNLAYAAMKNSESFAMFLFENDVYVNKPIDEYDKSLLHFAIRLGYKKIASYLIDKYGVDKRRGNSALHVAVSQSPHFVKLLLDNGVPVDTKLHGDGRTPLHAAVNENKQESIRLLLKSNADICTKDKYGETPIHVAISKGFCDIAKSIIDTKNKETAINFDDLLVYSINKGCHTNVIEMLIDYGANPDGRHGSGKPYLQSAIMAKNVDLALVLIKKGANIHQRYKENITPLHLAVLSELDCVVKLLVERGVDINAFDNNDQTPLFYAAKKSSSSMVKRLLELGAHPSLLDHNGRNPLLVAVKNKDHTSVKHLLDAGADITVEDQYGRVPLHLSLLENDYDSIKHIIEKYPNAEKLIDDMMKFRKMNPIFPKYPLQYMPGLKNNMAVIEVYTQLVMKWTLMDDQWKYVPMNIDLADSLDMFRHDSTTIHEVLKRTTAKKRQKILNTAGRQTLLMCLNKLDVLPDDLVRHVMTFAV